MDRVGAQSYSQHAFAAGIVVSANFSPVFIGHDSHETIRVRDMAALLTVSLSEFVVFSFMRFLMDAGEFVTADFVSIFACVLLSPRSVFHSFPVQVLFLRLCASHWFLVPLPKTLMDSIYPFVVFEMVACSRFDAGRCLLALERSCKVDWATVTGSSEPFLLYNF